MAPISGSGAVIIGPVSCNDFLASLDKIVFEPERKMPHRNATK